MGRRGDKSSSSKLLAEVCTQPTTEDPDAPLRFKPFEDWKERYEPTKLESERKKKIKAKVATKAKQVLPTTLSNGISAKLLVILLEVSSKLLTLAELEAIELSEKSDENDVPTAAVLLNVVNGIILTYRFDVDRESKKFAYMRRLATDMLTDTVQQVTHTAEDRAAILLRLQDDISKLLESKQAEARVLASTMLDELAVTAGDKVENILEEEIENVEDKMAEMELVADNLLGTSGTAVSKQLETGTAGAKVAVQEKKQTMEQEFGDFIKLLILNEMDKVSEFITFGMDQLFSEFHEIFSRAVKFEHDEKLHEGLQVQIYELVERIYQETQDAISERVQKVVNMLGAIMDYKEPPKQAGKPKGGDKE